MMLISYISDELLVHSVLGVSQLLTVAVSAMVSHLGGYNHGGHSSLRWGATGPPGPRKTMAKNRPSPATPVVRRPGDVFADTSSEPRPEDTKNDMCNQGRMIIRLMIL